MSLLEELKEKRQDAIENVAAEDLDIEATNLTLAEHQRVRAFWVAQINDLDKAIAALSPSEALLDPQPEAASPEFASEQGEPIEEMIATSDAVCEELSEAYTQDSEPSPQPEPLVPLAEAVLQTLPGGVEESRDQSDERTEDVSQAETAIEQTLITDDIPSIPREEIPVGAAVETYTDSGIETVKLGGQTYVVDGDPAQIEAGKQPAPQIPPELEGLTLAAYAPVNSEPASDALMWANGFEADAKSKAEPEQDKRPFWMFGKKELA